MNDLLKSELFRFIEDIVLNLNNEAYLRGQFNITENQYLDIKDEIETNFSTFSFSICDYSEINKNGSRPLFEVYYMNDQNNIGFEVALYSNGNITDLTLYGEIEIDKILKLNYVSLRA